MIPDRHGAAPSTFPRIAPHRKSDHPEAPAAEIASSYMEEQGLARRTQRDGRVVFIDRG